MGSLVRLTRRMQVVSRPRHWSWKGTRQLDLVLDDERLRAMTPTERHVVLIALARLLLEAGGVVLREVGHDHA